MAIFTGRTERAIAWAAGAHRDQSRKGEGRAPYIVHPVTVALILARYTDDEDTIIAGLLHDVLEDTDVTEEILVREFGSKVADMVRDVTAPTLRALSWDTRRDRYLRHLASAPRGSLLVAGADKIANLVSILSAQAVDGDQRWERFHAPAPQKLALYRGVYDTVRRSWPTCPLLRELHNRLEEVERKLLHHP